VKHEDNSADKVKMMRMGYGSKIPWTTLTEEEGLRLLQMYADGVPADEIAKLLGITPKNVRRIANGSRWKYAPGIRVKGHRPEQKRGEETGAHG